MKYPCPICRVPLDRDVGDMWWSGRHHGILCTECMLAPQHTELKLPFPWKRRAAMVWRRAMRTLRAMQSRRAPTRV